LVKFQYTDYQYVPLAKKHPRVRKSGTLIKAIITLETGSFGQRGKAYARSVTGKDVSGFKQNTCYIIYFQCEIGKFVDTE
jgi:hypothetical protein